MKRPIRQIMIAISVLLLCLQTAGAGVWQGMDPGQATMVICGENGVQVIPADDRYGPPRPAQSPSPQCCDCDFCNWLPSMGLLGASAGPCLPGHKGADPIVRLMGETPPLWPVRPATRAPPPTSRGLS